ncbi:signal peptidase I [Macrococcus equi]|uniref:signal peptidase I n=1 Tax=Macrococcus equi TaxID=3395462 RepID=UPI0039BE8286
MNIKKWAMPCIFILIFIVIFRSFFISNYMIEGHSMEPTLNDGDRVFVNQSIDIMIEPRIDDIFFFKLNNKEVLVKRILATPGDYLKVSKGQLFINGRKTRYKDNSMNLLLRDQTKDYRIVPEDCYLVIGDNISISTDSRTFGCISRKQMLGKVIHTYWHNNKR